MREGNHRTARINDYNLSQSHRVILSLFLFQSSIAFARYSALRGSAQRTGALDFFCKTHIKRTRNGRCTRTLCLSHSLTHSLNHTLLLLSPHCLFHSPLLYLAVLFSDQSYLAVLFSDQSLLLITTTHHIQLITHHSSHLLLSSRIFPSSILLSLYFSLLVLTSLTCGVIRSFYCSNDTGVVHIHGDKSHPRR